MGWSIEWSISCELAFNDFLTDPVDWAMHNYIIISIGP